MHARTGAHANEEPLFAGQPPRHLVGRIVVDVDLLIQRTQVVDARYVGLLEVLEALDLVAEVGFDTDDADFRIELAESPGASHERSRGSDRSDEVGDASLGLLPDFGGRPFVVGEGVGGVVELVGQVEPVRFVGGHLVGDLDGAVGALFGRGQQDFCSVGRQDFATFDRHALTHG